MNDCCTGDCRQGRDCPARSESDSHRLGLTVIAWLAGIAFLIFTVVVAVLMNPHKPY